MTILYPGVAKMSKIDTRKLPYKTSKKGGRKKKGPKASVKGGGGLLAVPNPFPLIWKGARQSFSDTLVHTVGTSGVFGAETAYTLNDQFDPRFSIGGAQPYARDTFVTMYERYKVTGITVEVTYSNASDNGIACGLLFGNPTNTLALAGSTYDRIKEAPQSRIMILNNTGGNGVKTFKKYLPMWRCAGVEKKVYEADIGIYDALAGNSPSADGKCFLRVAIADLGMGSTATATVSVRLIMHTNWYQRKMLAQS